MINFTSLNTFKSTPPAPPAGPSPTPPPTEEKEGFIRRGIEGAAGLVGGVIGSVIHTPAGLVEGFAEGLTSHRGSESTGWYHTIMFAQFAGSGAVTGALLGGPVGALVGAGVGLAADALNYIIERRGEVPHNFVKAVEGSVDQAIKNNTEGSRVKIAVQNATQGMILGTGMGFKGGYLIGRDAGKGVAGGFLDVGQGILQGIRDAISSKK